MKKLIYNLKVLIAGIITIFLLLVIASLVDDYKGVFEVHPQIKIIRSNTEVNR